MMNYLLKRWLSRNDFHVMTEEDIGDEADHMNYLVQQQTKVKREELGKRVFEKACGIIWDEEEELFYYVFSEKEDIHHFTDEKANLLCILWDKDAKWIEIGVDALNCRLECKMALARLKKDEKEYAVEFANEANRFLRIGRMYVEKDGLYYMSCLVYSDRAEKIDIYSYLEEASLVCEFDMVDEIGRELGRWMQRKVVRMIAGADDVYCCVCLGERGNRLGLSDVFLDYSLPENPCVFKSLHGVYIKSEAEYTEYVAGLNEGLRTSKDEQLTHVIKSGLRFAQSSFAQVKRDRDGEVYCYLPEALMEDLTVEKGIVFAIVTEGDGILLFPNDMERLKTRYSFGRKETRWIT